MLRGPVPPHSWVVIRGARNAQRVLCIRTLKLNVDSDAAGLLRCLFVRERGWCRYAWEKTWAGGVGFVLRLFSLLVSDWGGLMAHVSWVVPGHRSCIVVGLLERACM